MSGDKHDENEQIRNHACVLYLILFWSFCIFVFLLIPRLAQTHLKHHVSVITRGCLYLFSTLPHWFCVFYMRYRDSIRERLLYVMLSDMPGTWK